MGCDLFAAFGMLWLPCSIILVPLAVLVHAIVVIRKRDALGAFLFWGLVPPILVLICLALLSAVGTFPRIGA